MDFDVPTDHRIKLKENEKKDNGIKKNNNKNCGTWKWQLYQWWLVLWYSHQMIIKGTGGLGNKRSSGDHKNYCIIEGGQNIEKSPGDLRRLAVTQTPKKYHQLTLMWKILKE